MLFLPSGNFDQAPLYSVPYVSGRGESTVLRRGFYSFADDMWNRSDVDESERTLWRKIFFGGLNTHEDVVDWIRMTWPMWVRYCEMVHRDPGFCPIAIDSYEEPSVSDVDDLVF